LGRAVVEVRVLDLYAGTGSLGLEALSRGASNATFVEQDRQALVALRANVAAVGLGGDVVAGSVEAFLSRGGEPFDLAFVDPPYAVPLASLNDVLSRLTARLTNGRGGAPPSLRGRCASGRPVAGPHRPAPLRER